MADQLGPRDHGHRLEPRDRLGDLGKGAPRRLETAAPRLPRGTARPSSSGVRRPVGWHREAVVARCAQAGPSPGQRDHEPARKPGRCNRPRLAARRRRCWPSAVACPILTDRTDRSSRRPPWPPPSINVWRNSASCCRPRRRRLANYVPVPAQRRSARGVGSAADRGRCRALQGQARRVPSAWRMAKRRRGCARSTSWPRSRRPAAVSWGGSSPASGSAASSPARRSSPITPR